MSWERSLNRQVHDPVAVAELKRVILSRLPVFRAPTVPAAWRRESARLRREALEKVYLRGLPADWVRARPRVVWGRVLRPDPAFRIRKLRYEIVPGYWIPALLYEPAKPAARAPVVLNPNGHHSGGKAADYKQIRCANLARRGVLALNMEFIGMGELQADSPHSRLAHLNLVGLAGVGLFYLALQKGLDVLLAHPQADPRRVAVTGLSGGGWQTIVISALDPRVRLAAPVAGYTSLRARVHVPEDIGDLEQAPPDMATVLDYQHLTAMLAPRPVLQILNESDDCCFATARARPVIVDAIRPTYAAFGAAENLQTHSNRNPGTHNYDADNRAQFYRFLNRHFNLGAPETDIHGPRDVRPETELSVGLPAGQMTLPELARRRAEELEPGRRIPRTPAERARLRARLAEALRLPRFRARAEKLCQTGDASVWRVRLGPWTVPMSVWRPDGARETTLMLDDHGRARFRGQAPTSDRNLYAADVYGTGENRVGQGLHMMLESTGARVLGLQVAQILACADLAARQTGAARVRVRAQGLVMPVAALLAAALEPRRFLALDLDLWLSTFRLLLDTAIAYEEIMPLYCFGLLEAADLPEIKALLEGVELLQRGRCVPPERA
jgi:cephalosporin-C deacetylase-like acetyl esterase